jgi:hypothetical protein
VALWFWAKGNPVSLVQTSSEPGDEK